MSDEATGARVLIVDDDRLTLDALVEAVAASGHVPLPATSWADAVLRFRKERPDVVLLDLVMPTIDGYKLAAMIKHESVGFVPVILVTALGDPETKRRGMAAGADDLLHKPVSTIEVQVRIGAMLRIKALTDRLEAANRMLEELATTDALTGLLNRRAVSSALVREHERMQRYGHPLAVMLLDVDHFKQVNDRYGHEVGDRVLERVATTLRETVRRTDMVGRYGGEEFLVVAPELELPAAQIMSERIRLAISSRVSEGAVPAVTVSIGIAGSDHPDATGCDALVRLADSALYVAKEGGRNRCRAWGRDDAGRRREA